jgi:ABC-type glycerol-3-phosphate transport system substrate-binding protein
VPAEVSNAFAVWPTVYARQLATLSGEAVPDLVLLDSRWTAALAKADVLADLAPLLRTERWFEPGAYAGDVLAAGRVRGRQLGLPLAVFADTLLYDAKAFQAQGVKPPRADWLWSELVGTAQALTRRGRWGLYLRATGSARPFESSPSPWTIAWQRGASLVDRDGVGMTLSEPGLLEALEFLADLVHRQAVARPPDPDTSIAEVMAQRETAMAATFNGQQVSWRTPQLDGFAPATWPLGTRPGQDDGVFGIVPLMAGVPRNAPRRDLALEALGALAGAVAEAVLMPAARRPANAPPPTGEVLPAEEAAVMERSRASARFLPGDFPYFAVAQLLDDELVMPVLTGRKRPEQAAADAQPALNRRLADFVRIS